MDQPLRARVSPRRAGRSVVTAAAAVAAFAAAAHAYHEDPIADRLFPSWNLPEPTLPTSRRFGTTSILYQVYVVGPHAAEIHFRNNSDAAWHFAFWFPGRQRAGDNVRVGVLPWFRDREETHVTVQLRSGRPGLSSTRMRIYDLRRGSRDEGAAESPFADVAGTAPPDETWMPVRPLYDDGVARRSNLLARFIGDGAGAAVEFLNPSPLDVHIRFEVPAAGGAKDAAPRVSVSAGGTTTVPVHAAATTMPLALARVVVSDMRVGEDVGPFFSEDRRADAGWMPLVTSDDSAPLPETRLLAIVSPYGEGAARVRFRSRMRTEVRCRFVLPGYQDAGREGTVVVVPPGAETETVVALDRPADARLAVARLRLSEVSHRDEH
jgi:hypothetical protein